MALGSNNPFPSVLTVEQGSTPTSPSSGRQRIFIRSSDHHLCRVNSAGGVTDIEGGSSTVITGAVYLSIDNGRLTTESGVPISTTDRTAQSTIYFTPYNGNQVAVYTGASWVTVTFSEISLALSSLTSGKNYDVFLVYDGSPAVLRLVLSAAWTNDTTRADALALQNGVTVKSGTPTYRHIGTIRTTGTTTTEDSGGITGTTQVGGKRFVWNRYNQVRRDLKVIDTTDSWAYTTDTIRQANGTAGNKVEWVNGDVLTLSAQVVANVFLGNNTRWAKAGVGVDSTSAFSGLVGAAINQSGATPTMGVTLVGRYEGPVAAGYHFASWNEKGANNTSTFTGDDGADSSQSGLTATIWN